MRILAGVVLGVTLLAFVPAEAQERAPAETRLFVAPIADRELGAGPTTYEYLDRLLNAPECSGVVPVGKEEIADFSVWFEFKQEFRGGHYMTLWDASGHWVAGGEAGGSAEIVAAACNTIAAEPTE
jgi:hypothetical protein